MLAKKGASDLIFTQKEDGSWKFASKACSGTHEAVGRTKYCKACSKLNHCVNYFTTSMQPDAKVDRLSQRASFHFATQPKLMQELLDNIRMKKDIKIKQLQRDIQRFQKAMEAKKDQFPVEHIEDGLRLRAAFDLIKPCIEKKSGKIRRQLLYLRT